MSTLCAGGAEVLKEFFGTSDIQYTRKAGSLPEETSAERSYDSIGEAVEDCENSRVYNGYHFRTGIDVGTEMAREQANHLLENQLTKRPGTEYPELTSATSDTTDELIALAKSGAPAEISSNATILDMDNNVLKEGTNNWTCIAMPGEPMCLDEQWMSWADSYLSQNEEVHIDAVWIGYMLQGDQDRSNIYPYAEEPTTEN